MEITLPSLFFHPDMIFGLRFNYTNALQDYGKTCLAPYTQIK